MERFNMSCGIRTEWAKVIRAGPVFEVIVRQRLAGVPKEETAGPQQVNNISDAQVQKEVNRRLRLLGRESEVQETPESELALDQGNCLIIPLLGTWESI